MSENTAGILYREGCSQDKSNQYAMSLQRSLTDFDTVQVFLEFFFFTSCLRCDIMKSVKADRKQKYQRKGELS